MKERGILMSGSMAQAAWEGFKEVTRRVVKPQPSDLDKPWPDEASHVTFWDMLENVPYAVESGLCPYGKVGATLYVKETWRIVGWSPDLTEATVQYRGSSSRLKLSRPVPETFKAQIEEHIDSLHRIAGMHVASYGVLEECEDDVPWKPSLFMPKWASRTLLEVTDIRLEPLHEITEEEAKREGVWIASPGMAASRAVKSHLGAFHKLWNDIQGDSDQFKWSQNPWVWAIGFKKVERE